MSLVVAVPQLPSGNLDQTEIFFHQFLGFESVAIDIGKMSSCYIRVEDIESLYNDLKARKTQFKVPLSDMPWGMREFQFDDSFFNAIKFGEKL